MLLLRKIIRWIKFLGRRRSGWLVVVVTWASLVLLAQCWAQDVSRTLLPPPPPDQNLNHFRRSAHLKHYLEHIEVLIEPSSPCPHHDLPIIVLVTSSPHHVEQRQAIRSTWGGHLPTFFVMALQGQHIDEKLVDNFVEAKDHDDIIVLDMVDHYQNLTLKTVLMLRWSQARCPHARHVFKTDDDVLLNPWTLRKLLDEHSDAKLIGYRVNNTRLHRDEYTKWFIPRWLHHVDVVPQYLSGTGYIINGKCLSSILEVAENTPLINLEDVYLTYVVSKSSLGYELVHDRRLSPFRPWLPLDCAYWLLASLHSLKPEEIAHAWTRIASLAGEEDGCWFYKNYLDSDMFLY